MQFCHGTWGVILLREEVVKGEDYKDDLSPNVVVHSMDIYYIYIYAEHRFIKGHAKEQKLSTLF